MEIILILSLLVVGGYWWDTLYTNDLALHYCKQLCRASDVQLLDGSVSRQRIWLRRSPNASMQICRIYSFEYSGDGESRNYGYVVLLGHQVAEANMQNSKPPES